MKISHKSICLTVILLGFLIPTTFSAGDASAQCRPLTSEMCVDTVGVFSDFSFSQIAAFWTVVAVMPQPTDDKDITLYSNCASGSILATSTGTSGADFIVGDFNHNAAGTFYPETSYGSQTDPYTIEWMTGREILP